MADVPTTTDRSDRPEHTGRPDRSGCPEHTDRPGRPRHTGHSLPHAPEPVVPEGPLPPLLAQLSQPGSRCPPLLAALLTGALAAGLGAAAMTAVAVLLWVASPYPDSGLGGAVRTAAALWLLAHGTELTRTAAATGAAVPVGLTPLLLAAVPVCLAHRAGREAVRPGPGHSARGTWAAATLGYLLVAAVVCGTAAGGGLRPEWAHAAVRVPLLAGAAVAAGVRRGRPGGVLPQKGPRAPRTTRPEALAAPSRSALTRRARRAVVRAACAGTVVLLVGGTLVAAAALVPRAAAVQSVFLGLAPDLPGRVALALLVLALVPNVAVWGAAFALGPGFLLGPDRLVAPLVPAPVPALPGHPVLPVLPDTAAYGAPYTWAAGVVPLAAGLAVAWSTAHAAAPRYGEPTVAWGAGRTVAVAAGAAVLCGFGTAALCGYAGGPMGTAHLARLGPVWWQTGAAALVWTAGAGVPGAVVLRWWRVGRG